MREGEMEAATHQLEPRSLAWDETEGIAEYSGLGAKRRVVSRIALHASRSYKPLLNILKLKLRIASLIAAFSSGAYTGTGKIQRRSVWFQAAWPTRRRTDLCCSLSRWSGIWRAHAAGARQSRSFWLGVTSGPPCRDNRL
jgi:hypothetical protein